MSWQSYADRTKEVADMREKLQRHLEPFNRPTPTSFPEEDGRQYEDRVMPILQQYAPGYEKVKVDALYRDNRELVVNQIYNAAAAEARRPTQIPEGELREVTRRDASGRPYYEYFGSPSAWLKDFTGDRKRLTGIKADLKFQKI